jgi:hypothetical protein
MMEVNQIMTNTTARVIQSLRRECVACNDHRVELYGFIDQREDAEAQGSKRRLRDADWYIQVATTMAQAHLIVDHSCKAVA